MIENNESTEIIQNNGLKLKRYTGKKSQFFKTRTKIGKHILNARYTKAYNMNQLRLIYNAPAINTTSPRVKIAIIQLGGGYIQSELTTFWNYLSLPIKPVVNSISVDGATNNPGISSDDDEVYLDIEVVGGMCPNSILNVYFAPNSFQSFYNAINKAIIDGNKIISISWGLYESGWGNTNMTIYNNLFKNAVAAGVTICVASGDLGARDDGRTLSVDFPASSPYVVACGGTTLNAPTNAYTNATTEIAWSGSGGGFSRFFTRPAYQNTFNTNSKRSVPDVAATADPNTGYIIYEHGNYYVIGGTSAVSPLYAGFLGLIDFKATQGQLNAQIYSKYAANSANKQMFNDVKSGNNGGYNAIVGYDMSTGLGSPNFNKIKSLIN
jgi:kumamolisin